MVSIATVFDFTGGQQSYTVPANVFVIKVRCMGAAGGTVTSNRGYGGWSQVFMAVTPGQVIYCFVGGFSTGVGGGYNGGGYVDGGTYAVGGGGGASDIRVGGTALSNRWVVAGGGGGGTAGGGKGGNGSGQNGYQGGGGPNGGGGGSGGTQTLGTLGIGGPGVAGALGSPGGGGGYRGGFGGANASGAGGGSGYWNPSTMYPTWGAGVYNSHGKIQINSYAPVNVPTAVGPVAGATATIPNPILTATQSSSDGQLQRVEWQFATDAGFTANLKTVTEAPGPGGVNDGRRVSGVATLAPTLAQLKLASGTWYVRARSVDLFNTYTAYSAANSFTVIHPPTSFNQTPTGNTGILYGAPVDFQWTFADPWAGDTQSAYEFIIELNDTGERIYDSGKVVSTAKVASYLPGVVYKDVALRWAVKLWDFENIEGLYCPYRIFRVTDPPVVQIQYPTAGGGVDSGSPEITWTVDAINTPVNFLVIFMDALETQIIFQSEILKSTQTSYAPPVTILNNNTTYIVKVQVQDDDGLWGQNQHTFTTSYDAPNAVKYIAENFYDTLGYVHIDWSETQADASFLMWKVYRTVAGIFEWETIFETTDVNRLSYNDWTATTGQTYQYTVIQSAYRSGVLLESDSNQYAVQHELNSSNYWLLNPNDETKNFLLHSVTSDSYTDEVEQESFVIIDRGRKTNYGTDLGKTGNMSAQLRDKPNVTARVQRQSITAMQKARSTYLLRDPFGNLLQISMGNIQVDRISGVGNAEFCDITFPYTEVY